MNNYAQVQEQVLAACKAVDRDSSEVSVIAVSKRQPIEKIQRLLAEARPNLILGENYVKEFADKRESLSGDYQVHLLGPLQSNKIKKAVSLFDLIQSVDSLKTLALISKEAAKLNKQQAVFLQVNISNDTNKSGFLPEDLKQHCQEILTFQNLQIKGLMTITRFYENKEDVRPDFIALRELRDYLQQTYQLDDLKLSMGMSADFDIAVQEGADFIRVGTAIFGARE